MQFKHKLVSLFGGEEFIFAIPCSDGSVVTDIAERIRELLANKNIYVENASIKVTVSIGIYKSDIDSISLEDAIKFADKALYKAKNTGRNKVVNYADVFAGAAGN